MSIVRGHGRLSADGQKTNFLLWSEDQSNGAWSQTATVGAGETDPNGGTNAFLVTDVSAVAASNVAQTIACADDRKWRTASIFLAKDSDETRFPEVGLLYLDGTNARREVMVNTATGATADVSNVGTTAVSVLDHGTFWRVAVSVLNNGTGNARVQIVFYPARGTIIGTPDVAAQGTAIIFGVQINIGSRALHYLKTTDRAR